MWCGVKVSAYVVFQFKINHIKAFKGFLNKAHFLIKIFFRCVSIVFYRKRRIIIEFFHLIFETIIISKEKKEKKESTDAKWRVSKKQVFFKKYYRPDSSFGCRVLWYGRDALMKIHGWWRFFKKPGGLELAFL
jgi:hypothetical protein